MAVANQTHTHTLTRGYYFDSAKWQFGHSNTKESFISPGFISLHRFLRGDVPPVGARIRHQSLAHNRSTIWGWLVWWHCRKGNDELGWYLEEVMEYGGRGLMFDLGFWSMRTE